MWQNGQVMKKGQQAALEELAKRISKDEDTRELAKGALSLASELLYLNGCVERGRGSDIYPDQPCRNVFEYIKELEVKLKETASLVEDFHGCCDAQLDKFRKQGITEGMRHYLRIAEAMVGDPTEDDLQKFIDRVRHNARY